MSRYLAKTNSYEVTGPTGDGGGYSAGSTPSNLTVCSGPTAQARINQTATNLAEDIKNLGSNGNEHGYLIGMTTGGSVVSIGPFTSNESGSISTTAILSAAAPYRENTLIVGQIHNHPSTSSHYTNRVNFNPSFRDVTLDNALASRGYNVSPSFTHFIVTPTNQLSAYRDGSGPISQNTARLRCTPRA